MLCNINEFDHRYDGDDIALVSANPLRYLDERTDLLVPTIMRRGDLRQDYDGHRARLPEVINLPRDKIMRRVTRFVGDITRWAVADPNDDYMEQAIMYMHSILIIHDCMSNDGVFVNNFSDEDKSYYASVPWFRKDVMSYNIVAIGQSILLELANPDISISRMAYVYMMLSAVREGFLPYSRTKPHATPDDVLWTLNRSYVHLNRAQISDYFVGRDDNEMFLRTLDDPNVSFIQSRVRNENADDDSDSDSDDDIDRNRFFVDIFDTESESESESEMGTIDTPGTVMRVTPDRLRLIARRQSSRSPSPDTQTDSLTNISPVVLESARNARYGRRGDRARVVELIGDNTTEYYSQRECAVCLENEANTTLFPCRHRNACSECAVRLLNCPTCRSPVNLQLERRRDRSRSPLRR